MNNDAYYCQMCGTKLDEGINFCPKCGCRQNKYKDVYYTQNDFADNSSKKKNKNVFYKIINSKLFNPILFVVLVIFIFSLFSSNLSTSEENALDNTNYLIAHMKDPDSFKLTDDIVHVRFSDKRGDWAHKDVYYISYSASNSFGAQIRSTCCFFNGKYYDLDDSNKIDKDDYSSNEDYVEALNSDVTRLALSMYLSEWNLLGGNDESFELSEVIDAKKIAKKAHCDYSK